MLLPRSKVKEHQKSKAKNLQSIVTASSGIAHAVSCPFHGLPAILLKVGLLPAVIASPLYVFHEKAVHGIEYCIKPLVNQQYSHQVAHNIIDYGGWIALGIFGVSIANNTYKKMKNRKVTHNNNSRNDTHTFPNQ